MLGKTWYEVFLIFGFVLNTAIQVVMNSTISNYSYRFMVKWIIWGTLYTPKFLVAESREFCQLSPMLALQSCNVQVLRLRDL